MSAKGHSRPSRSMLVLTNVCCYSNNRHSVPLDCPLSAESSIMLQAPNSPSRSVYGSSGPMTAQLVAPRRLTTALDLIL